MSSPSKIFISYRRSDSAAYAGRLADSLVNRYGRECVFFDINAIEPGVELAGAILTAVQACEIMLVIIGRDWLMDWTNDGVSRLLDPNDFIRIQIIAAVKSKTKLIPVLVAGATMPDSDSLPTELKELAYRNAFELSNHRWSEDLEHLYRVLESYGNLKPQDSNAGLWSRLANILREGPGPVASKPPPLSYQTPEPPDSLITEIPEPPASPLIFVSHADKDRALVETVVEKLEAGGLNCWVSYRDIPAGEPSWAGFIVGAIAKAKLMVIVVTPNAVTSKQVLREVTVADSENIAFLPFLLEKTTLPNEFKYFFSTGQQLNVGDAAPSEALDRLTAAVRKRLVIKRDQ